MSITEETRRESYEMLDNASIRKHIVELLGSGAKMTAKEVAVILYSKGCVSYPMRQSVAPRLTELMADGIIEACGKAYDSESGRHVAVYRPV